VSDDGARSAAAIFGGEEKEHKEMKISDVIRELEHTRNIYGDIDVVLQNDPDGPDKVIVGHEAFFIVPEEYPEFGMVCNMRIWPY